MAKYRKKPVVIDAWLWDGSDAMTNILLKLSKDIFLCVMDSAPNEIEIHTLEGRMTAQIGDWIIKGVKGEFYPCKPDIFAATYDPA